MTATKNFLVDSFVAGLGMKAPCVAVATSNITLSGEQTINGVAVVTDDRVLVTAQAFSVDNGIYVVETSTWTRAGDFDGNRDVVKGTMVAVTTAGQAALYELTSANPITVGTSALTFSQRYGSNINYEQTAAEIAAGVTPVNYQYDPGNVLRYGTNTTPGTTDMTTPITNAVNSGHDVFFPKGTYAIHTDSNSDFADAPTSAAPVDSFFFELTSAHDGLKITGEGRGSIIKVIGGGQGRAGSPSIFYLNDASDITFDHLSFDGNAENTFTSNPLVLENGFAAIYFWPTSNGAISDINIEHCYFTKFGNGCINGYGWASATYPHYYTDQVNVSNCTFEYTGSHGIAASEWRNCRIDNCLFKNVGKNIMISAASGSGLGVDLSGGCIDNIVSNCIVDGGGGGFKTETHDNSGTAVKSINNIFDSCIVRNLYTGTYFEVWYGFKLGGDHTVVNNCIVEDSVGENIVITNSDCTVSNCRLLGNTDTVSSAVLINGQDPRFTPENLTGNQIITNNYIKDAATNGIQCLASNTIISNNIIENSGVDAGGGSGIRIADPNSAGLSTKNVTVTGNQVKDSVGVAIAIDDLLSGEEVSNIIVTGNMCFDTRSGASRTQTYGIYYPSFASGTEEVFDIIESNNRCFNNITLDYPGKTNGATIMANGKKLLSFGTAPTVGTWAVGDIVFNTAPAAGGTVGWVCTTAGTPGTWKIFGGTIEA